MQDNPMVVGHNSTHMTNVSIQHCISIVMKYFNILRYFNRKRNDIPKIIVYNE